MLWVRNAAAAFLVVLGLSVIVFVLFAPPKAPPPYSSPSGFTASASASPSAQPTALFIGDDYVAGVTDDGPSGSDDEATFAKLTADELGWVANVDAENGTGYLAKGGSKTSPYGKRLAADKKAFTANYVIISSGTHDLDVDVSGYDAAVRGFFRDVRLAYPKAKVVVLAPFWAGNDPPQDQIDARVTVKAAAAATGVQYVTTQGWLTASSMASDNVHLTPAGQRAVAARLGSVLKSWSNAKSTPTPSASPSS